MKPDIIYEIFEGEGNAQEKLYRLYGKKIGYSTAAAYMAGIKLHINTMKLSESNGDQTEPNQGSSQEEVSFNKDSTKTIKTEVYLTSEEAASPTLIMQKMGLDPILWEVVSCKVTSGIWDVTLKLENTNIIDGEAIKQSTPHTVRNKKYSIILTVRPLSSKLGMPQILEAFNELKPIMVPEIVYKEIPDGDELLFELPMMDFHIGKLAWAEETGSAYDLKIAEKLWIKSVIDLINKAVKFGQIKGILFPIGQDFFHFDTPRVTTTNGTQLNTDTRWQKMFRKGVELLAWSIDKLLQIAPVRVLWVPGNHDQMLSYAAVVGIYQRYLNVKEISVDLSAAPRKYISYGNSLIGYSHGDKEGKRLFGLMQVEAPDQWGKSIFREFHMGHLHTEMATESNNGIIFRRISTLTASDAWHGENGFLGSTRQAQAFMWDKKYGLQGILNSNVIEEGSD